jgi:hypothetical protein
MRSKHKENLNPLSSNLSQERENKLRLFDLLLLVLLYSNESIEIINRDLNFEPFSKEPPQGKLYNPSYRNRYILYLHNNQAS